MSLKTHITLERLEDFSQNLAPSPEWGSRVEFLGVIRPEEDGEEISFMDYQAYEPMAHKVMQQILLELQRQWKFDHAEVVHRTGRVPVGEAAIRVRIWSEHRKEAFEACVAFMNRLKEEVPIWKFNPA